jgi:pyruvate dehydrogenase E2 component (dihydrolipoamide acetyltransferase)
MAEVVIMPKLGFDMAEGTLVRWVVHEGESVGKGDVLAEIETDKATVEVESSYDGVVLKHLAEEGAIVPVSTPIAIVGEAGEEIEIEALAGVESLEVVSEAAPGVLETEDEVVETLISESEPEIASLPDGVRASPIARRMAVERGVNLGQVKGSGPGGRIVKADVLAYAQAPPAPIEVPAASPMPLIEGELREDIYVPMSRLRAAIGRRMTEVKQQVPHFYVTHEYDMAVVMTMRKQVNALLPEGEKTSVNDYIVKAAALALLEFPNLNASLDEANNRVIQHGQINVGSAVAVENGLLTVVCHDTDRKSIRMISREVKEMAARARQGKVRPDDIEGSTFSVSNLGMFDVEHFIAILNPPEAAILAVGSAREVPAVEDGEIKLAWRMKATISVDHRVSDGAEAAQFLQAVAKYLEEPLRLMVNI